MSSPYLMQIVEILSAAGSDVDRARQKRDEARLIHELRERQRLLIKEYVDRLAAEED